jgi:hypothetical protein
MRKESRVKLDPQQLSKIRDEMPLNFSVSRLELLHITFVKLMQLHA